MFIYLCTTTNIRYNFNRKHKTFEVVQDIKLTKREMEILNYIAIGNQVELISKELKISESTIKNHKTKIFKKLHANNSAEAVFFASKQNII